VRHQLKHQKLAQGFAELGIEFIVPETERLPQLNLVNIPQGLNDEKSRKFLLDEYNLEIGAGLGMFAGNAWRIGLMGYSARNENVALCLAALKDTLHRFR
jgi:alanine-glyoxylate transaminase/serine-glyoxylate transaminase/serine-pyruvate transaminase